MENEQASAPGPPFEDQIYSVRTGRICFFYSTSAPPVSAKSPGSREPGLLLLPG